MDATNKPSTSRENRSLRIVRHFDMSPDVVFDAFTDPKTMRSWWTDDTTFEIDLRVGGRWTIKRKEGETEFVMTGEYLEIEKPNRLKYTIAMPQFSPNTDVVSIAIAPDEKSGSVMTFIQTGVDIANELKDLPEGNISESEKGWQQGFDLMDEALKK